MSGSDGAGTPDKPMVGGGSPEREHKVGEAVRETQMALLPPVNRRFSTLALTMAMASMLQLSSAAFAQTSDTQDPNSNIPSGSPVSPGQAGNEEQERAEQPIIGRYEPASINTPAEGREEPGERSANNRNGEASLLAPRRPPPPGEFETWAQEYTGVRLKRFGSDLLLPSNRDFAVPAVATVPPDYALNVGDVVSVALTGSVDGSANFEIDRDGRIFLPNVGAVSLVGVRYRDLKDRIAQAIGRKYRNFEISVSIQRLRGVRVYVTGFANSPGAYTVNSLSTLINAVLAAGGPSAGGSFRSVKLYRNGAQVVDFDLYDLLRNGDRSNDPLLQNEDVLFISPAGRQVAVVGSVNEQAIYESLPGESLADTIRMAGGPTDVADASRAILYRLSDRDTVGSREIMQADLMAVPVEAGDIIQILPQGTLTRPLERQQVVIRVEGEVNKPGNYYVPPNTPLGDVINMAGGLTTRAFVYGTTFSRESVRVQQRKSFLEAIEQMEFTLAAAPLNSDRTVDAGERQLQIASARAFVNKLRQNEPDGRLVLNITPGMPTLPEDLLLENHDRIVVPPRVNTVGVFGAVYRPASFLLDPLEPLRVRDYVSQAGGAIRGADKGNIFVVRANGSVLTRSSGAMSARAIPGDTIFVPIKTQSSSLLATLRDISQVVFQFGLSAAAVAAIQ